MCFKWSTLLFGRKQNMKATAIEIVCWRTGCNIYGFVSGLSGTVSIMTLAAIAVDRYLVIGHPLKVEYRTNCRRNFITSGMTWIYALIFSSLPLIDASVGGYVPEGYLTSCSFNYLSKTSGARLFVFIFFLAAWLVPFVIIFSCYTAIIVAVNSSRKDTASYDNSSVNRSSRLSLCLHHFPHLKTILKIRQSLYSVQHIVPFP